MCSSVNEKVKFRDPFSCYCCHYFSSYILICTLYVPEERAGEARETLYKWCFLCANRKVPLSTPLLFAFFSPSSSRTGEHRKGVSWHLILGEILNYRSFPVLAKICHNTEYFAWKVQVFVPCATSGTSLPAEYARLWLASGAAQFNMQSCEWKGSKWH